MASRRSNYQASHIFDQPDTQAKNISQNLEPKTYYSYSHTSPYVDGKKNSQYVHPSLISNQVFYNQDEGQKRPATSANQEYNRNKTEESYRNQDNRPVTGGQKGRRESNREDYDYGHEEADRYKSGTGGREDQRYYERDDRSESSTLSSAGYLCPNCLNRHIYEDQRNACKRQREEDMERERRIADANNRIAREEEEQERYSRNKRVTQSRELKDQLDQNYNTKLENRRSPKRESASAFNNIFEKQDELVEKNRNKNQEFRSSLQDQMYQSSMKKNQEKQANLSPYGTSLQIGEGYHNKYIEGASNNIKEALKDQVEEKSQKQRREREAERRLAQQTSEQALREQEEEERRRREQDWRQKNQLKDHLLRTIEDNRSRKHEEVASKVNERTLVDQKYLDYKRKQAEEEEKAKRQLFDYGRALHNQQEHSSYKKQYDERRNQKESTSFDPSPTKSRKLYPCGECNVPYERSHLTKHH